MPNVIPMNKLVRVLGADGKALGYAWAKPGDPGTDERDQVQRWFLYTTDLSGKMPPRNPIIVEEATAPAAPWDMVTSVETFIQTSRAEFKEGQHLYVKVNCLHITGQHAIPLPIPVPAHLPPIGGASQADVGTAQLYDLIAEQIVGYVFTLAPSSDQTVEHWVLFNGYREPIGGTRVSIDNLKRAEDFADLLSRNLWNASATLVVAACGYYPKFPSTP